MVVVVARWRRRDLVLSNGSFTLSCPVTSVAGVLSCPMTASRCVPSDGSVTSSCPSLLAASCGAMGGQEDNKSWNEQISWQTVYNLFKTNRKVFAIDVE